MHIEIECLEQCDPCSSTWYSSFNVSCSWDMHTAYTLGMREGVWLLKEEDSDPGLSNLPCGVLIARSQTPPFGFTIIVEHKKKERNLSKMESHQVGVGYFHLDPSSQRCGHERRPYLIHPEVWSFCRRSPWPSSCVARSSASLADAWGSSTTPRYKLNYALPFHIAARCAHSGGCNRMLL